LVALDGCRAELRGELFHQRFCDERSLGGERRRRRARLESFDPAWLADCRVDDLFTHDHAGWAPLHYVAFHGHQQVGNLSSKLALNWNSSSSSSSSDSGADSIPSNIAQL